MSERYAVICPACAVTIAYADTPALAEEIRKAAEHGDIDPADEPYVRDTHGVGDPKDDEHMTPEQWRKQEERDAIEYDERREAFDRFREDAEDFIRNAAIADDHSSDVDPGDFEEEE